MVACLVVILSGYVVLVLLPLPLLATTTTRAVTAMRKMPGKQKFFFLRLRSFLRYRGQNIAIGGLVDIDLNHKAAAFIDATDELVDK